jgi:hypothetical protein
MRRLARPTLILALIVLHGAVSLCGSGLHALPGFGHESEIQPRAKNDHSHGPGKSPHESSEDCQLCQVLAQGQLVTDPVTCACGWLEVGTVPLLDVSPASDAHALPSIPRAPPLAHASDC